ncbi:hypothetical protein SODALDRAFT_320358 [Sodiomyces alkalinus F11]|uniref:FYVE-type domain-containing protein n=1 Tax=Sodiomyces alkalinus (strain CBS 110278 / VKM F-3762 / F11) TaxID=1314773 RepID=A0A3N2PN62_SODAK|nr:hypothetical protein SODALDRAFT_320358 [Sodiomyces alkalinus F11]ROT35864.1 hypothetical protein SODALDRAFT_320358 [Sodiomyces alkalinus F11]
MAADLIMPAPFHNQQAPPSHYFAPTHQAPQNHPYISHGRSHSYQIPPTSHSQQEQISPSSTSGHNSPTTPTGRFQGARQSRPLFMPAALRPTRFPSKLPRSLQNEGPADGPQLTLRRASNSFINIPGLGVFGSRLGRRATGDSNEELDADLDPSLYPQATGEPTRKHWKPDALSTICDDPTCKRAFNYFYRRHHCRKCGNIFCDPHSSYAIPLDQDCNYNPRASPSRSCAHCFSEFVAWKSRNNSQASSERGSSVDHSPVNGHISTAPSTAPTSPIATSSPMSAASSATLGHARAAEAAASVPRDWSWSTF